MKNQAFYKRMHYAIDGIKRATSDEKSFRTQLLFAVLAGVFLLLFRPDLIWWALIGVMVALVLAAELINTSLENLADHLHPEEHPRIKAVKDCAAGAVLLLSIGALWVALLALISVV